MTFSLINPTAPVRIMPRLIKNIDPTVMTAGLAKPAMASLGAKIPLRTSATIMPMEVRSTGSFSVTNRIMATIKIAVTSQISILNPHPFIYLNMPESYGITLNQIQQCQVFCPVRFSINQPFIFTAVYGTSMSHPA